MVRRDRTLSETHIGSDPGGLSGGVTLIACGALAQPAAAIAERRGWALDVLPLPPLLHNQPHLIADAVREVALPLLASHQRVLIGYADCGTYGALDDLCAELGVERLPGLHCYDVYAGPERLAKFFEDQPGTYVFTDFLVKSFHRTVIRELGLDRFPELRDDYFKSYTRVVWLAQEPDAELTRLAREAAERLGLPLTIVDTGHAGLEHALAGLLGTYY
jgi:Protein of unknown function (DUF1638)